MKKKSKKEVKSMDLLDYTPNLEVKELETIIKEEPEVLVEEKPQQAIIYTVKVTHPSLRMRKGPSLSADIVGFITDEGNYGIVDENNGWGKLENGNWIMLTYTKKIEI